MKTDIFETLKYSNFLDIEAIKSFIQRQRYNASTFWDHFFDVDMTIYDINYEF
jgi:hypothetical protein